MAIDANAVVTSRWVFLRLGILRNRTWLWLISPLLCGGATGWGTEPINANGGASDVWRISERCGVNSAYVYLRLHNIRVEYDSVLSGIAIGEDGSSLEDIKQFICSKGTSCEVRRATPKQLPLVCMPCVAHMVPDESSSSFEPTSNGHFVVLVEVNDEHVKVIDGTTGILEAKPLDEFIRNWSGYLLVDASGDSSHLLIVCFVGCAMIVCFVSCRLRIWFSS